MAYIRIEFCNHGNYINKCKDCTILKLQSQIPRWVPVSEELPPYNAVVLVYQPNWKGQLVTAAEFVGINESGFKFCFDYNTCLFDRNNFRYSVTHWMPLPPPPQESEGE